MQKNEYDGRIDTGKYKNEHRISSTGSQTDNTNLCIVLVRDI